MTARLFLPLSLALALLPLPAPAQVIEEVPFITTPDSVTLAMLKLAGVGPRDHVIDLGSGDGRIVITAARRFGASGLGVEIVPELVARSREAAEQAGVARRVDFREQDLFSTDLSSASVITMYLLPEVNLQLRPALLKLAPGTRIVSHDWDLGDWWPDETLTVDVPDKKIGREKLSRVHRWVVPARADGLWCGPGSRQLRVTQRYQSVQLQWRVGTREQTLQGRLDGRQLQAVGAGNARLQARVDDDRIAVQAPSGRRSAVSQSLTRAPGQDCPG